MGAREISTGNAFFVAKWVGILFCGAALFLFNREHSLVTVFFSLPPLILGLFFFTVVQIRLERGEAKYRRWFRWRAISYSEIRACGEFWIYGYLRPRQFIFPWGRIYFARPQSADSWFGWDKEVIDTIRSRSHL
jgi:hypothetical protein